MKRNARERIDATLEALYARVPALDCKGLCHTSCGAIECSNREHDRIRTAAGVDIPTFSEFAAQGRMGTTIVCPALSELGRCTAYEIRPMICRLWGAMQSVPCPYGCTPLDGGPLLDDGEGMELLAESLMVGGDPEGRPSASGAEIRAMYEDNSKAFEFMMARGRAGDQRRADEQMQRRRCHDQGE